MEEKSLAELNSKLVIHSGWLVLTSIAALSATIGLGGVSWLAVQAGLGVGLLWAMLLPLFWKKNWYMANGMFTTWSAVVVSNWVATDNTVWPTFQFLSLVVLSVSIAWFSVQKWLLAYLNQSL